MTPHQFGLAVQTSLPFQCGVSIGYHIGDSAHALACLLAAGGSASWRTVVSMAVVVWTGGRAAIQVTVLMILIRVKIMPMIMIVTKVTWLGLW